MINDHGQEGTSTQKGEGTPSGDENRRFPLTQEKWFGGEAPQGNPRRTSGKERERFGKGGTRSILYRHLKTGRLYVILGPAMDKSDAKENDEQGRRMIHYLGMNGMRYVRTEREFKRSYQQIENPDQL